MTAKPPLPERMFDPWPRIAIDEDSSQFREIRKLAVLAADEWATGPDGPYKHTDMTLAQIVSGSVREALLHLLELGLIDIDADRIANAKGWPMSRTAFVPPASA